jgi:hypothetical protein
MKPIKTFILSSCPLLTDLLLQFFHYDLWGWLRELFDKDPLIEPRFWN